MAVCKIASTLGGQPKERLIEEIKVTKLDAAKRQLRTALQLWFADGDPIAIQTLVAAAHELIHTLFRARGNKGLLFDTPHVPKANRQKWTHTLRKPPNFLKHAQHDLDEVLEFRPVSNNMVLLMCCVGLGRMGEPVELEHSALIYWFVLHQPELFFLKDEVSEISAESIDSLRKVSRAEFLEVFTDNWRQGHRPAPILQPADAHLRPLKKRE
jgi:hypothetical protein